MKIQLFLSPLSLLFLEVIYFLLFLTSIEQELLADRTFFQYFQPYLDLISLNTQKMMVFALKPAFIFRVVLLIPFLFQQFQNCESVKWVLPLHPLPLPFLFQLLIFQYLQIYASGETSFLRWRLSFRTCS